MWTLILHFNRGYNEIISNLTQEEVQEHIRVVVFANKDCINFSCFKNEVNN